MPLLDFSQLRFLLIDDFANYRSMLRSILVSCGAQHIDDTSNAADALKKVSGNKFDVILCDYNLGDGQNGQQLLEEIMHRHLIPYGTIYIMITAENTQSMVMAAVEYRPDGYLNKPFPKELLIKRLDMLVQKKAIMKDIYKAYNKKEYSKALSLADETMARHSKQALEIGKLKGEIALTANELDIAQQVYDKALSVRDFQWAKVGKARVFMAQKDYEQAQSLLQEVIKENKNYIEAYDLLAEILELQGNTEEVQKVLSVASSISPLAVSRQQHLAHIAVQNDDYDTAEKSFRKAITQGKHSYLGKVSDNMGLAKLYIDHGKAPKAVQIISTARKTYKKDTDALLHTQFIESLAQHKLGNENNARELFQQAISSLPTHLSDLPGEFLDDLIATTEDLGETDLAEALKDDIANSSDHSDSGELSKKYHYLLLNGKGMRLYNSKQVRESIDFFEEAAENLPDRISVNMNAAQSLLFYLKATGNDKELLNKARHFLDISQRLDEDNEKYQKLEAIYSELN